MYRNIVVAGDIGTGTTTLAKKLASALDWQYFSSGAIYRSFVLKNNLKLWDHLSFPDSVDKMIDESSFEKIKNESGLVFDTHYGGWFARDLKDVLKILLICKAEIADERILKRDNPHRENLEDIEKRRVGNYKKFHKLYSADDYQDPKFYDLVIDSGENSIEATFEKALNFFKESH